MEHNRSGVGKRDETNSEVPGEPTILDAVQDLEAAATQGDPYAVSGLFAAREFGGQIGAEADEALRRLMDE